MKTESVLLIEAKTIGHVHQHEVVYPFLVPEESLVDEGGGGVLEFEAGRVVDFWLPGGLDLVGKLFLLNGTDYLGLGLDRGTGLDGDFLDDGFSLGSGGGVDLFLFDQHST